MVTLRWKHETSDGEFHHFWTQPVNAFLESTKSLLPRSFAHILLDELPSEALPGVLEYLADSWSFYEHPAKPVEPGKTRTVKGKVVRRSERPAYQLPDVE